MRSLLSIPIHDTLITEPTAIAAHSRKLYREKSGRALLWVPINDNLKHWEPLKIKVYERS
ncbi:hypothetical protein [Nostoc sp.]|uniref:hypothetical protein n=1 Tax=Nostoc sp. TaxID=1180 RepID=UPI002FFB6CB8